MRATSSKKNLLTCLIFLLCSTCSGVVTREKRSSLRPSLKRVRRTHRTEHHRPLTEAQKADQNLQFMLSLYRSAATPDGRPKQHRKFGSNTVRLIRPSTSSVDYLPASRDHHYTFTVQYNLDTLPPEQLVRASFIHLRSAAPPPSSDTTPRCQAQIMSLGKDSLVTMEPHQRWTETDITAHVHGHVLKGKDGDTHLTLTAQYWCTGADETGEGSTFSWWWNHLMGGKKWKREPHLEVPSLLLYVEQEQEVKDWMAELIGADGDDIVKQFGDWHPSVRRQRRSKEFKKPDFLKKSTSSISSFFPPQSSGSDVSNSKRQSSLSKNLCRLHSFTLSFNELGWGDYFIAPPGYNPRFCQGDCPSVLHSGYHSPNHAIIQTYINELGLGDVPPPSCVPYKYMPMSVLVMDKRKVEYKEMDDMMAESCTCR